MTAETPLDPIVLDAVREKLVRLDAELSAKEQEVARAFAAYQTAQASREQLQANRDKLATYLETHAAMAPDSVLGGATVTIRPWFAAGGGASKPLSPRSLKQEIIAKTRAALRDGGRMRSEEIYEYLLVTGLELNFENGPRRITQILSESGLFHPDRVSGWALKSETPNAQQEAQQEA